MIDHSKHIHVYYDVYMSNVNSKSLQQKGEATSTEPENVLCSH